MHIRNLTVSASSNGGKSPFELFTGKTAQGNHLRVFGCTAYVKKRKVNLRKLDSRSVTAKFIGYDSNSTAYVFQELVTKKIDNARNVLFKEDEIQPLSSKEEIYQEERILESTNLDIDKECSNEQTKEKPVADKVGKSEMKFQNNRKMNKKISSTSHFQEKTEIDDFLKDMEIPIPSMQLNKRKSRRNRKPTKKL